MIFNTPLSVRNVLGLLIVLLGSLMYAFASKYCPPQPLKRPFTLTNAVVVFGVVAFIAVQLKGVIADGDLCFRETESFDSITAATLIIKYPGDSESSGEEFVSQYLPPLFALLQRDPGWAPHKLPIRSEPLRTSTVSPFLLVNGTDSLLLHPELLPYIGSIFSEVLIDSNGILLRVVRDQNWTTIDQGIWQYLVVTSAVLEPSQPVTYVAIDSSTAICSLRAKQNLTAYFAKEAKCPKTSHPSISDQVSVGKLYPLPKRQVREAAMVREAGAWEVIHEENVTKGSTHRTVECVSPAKSLRIDGLHPSSANYGDRRRRSPSLPLSVRTWYDTQPHRVVAPVARCLVNSEAHVDANIVRKLHPHNTIRCDRGLGSSLILFSTVAVFSVLILVSVCLMPTPPEVHRRGISVSIKS
eukprot:TRINITY_DN6037_c1_g1_i2.p1 TRINITY_DN6037_c1_g1~~TRINITY_DN6037_c1_g1_i2.p1  ORF type:complete len:412 (+),score=57.17 TRINITY_DN6037_c1_g1_i2:958-2193(+)